MNKPFDPYLPHPFTRYGRMSDDAQNPRSPEQQFDTIESTRQRLNYPWVHTVDYRDDAITGRFVRRRPGFSRMLADIKTGKLQVDIIAVDTFERFGRADELAEIRRKLFNRHGVMLLTADSNFADPTTVSGKALAMVESIRSTEDGRIKRHNVLRGKRDAARMKHWPGGSPPFGYMLESVLCVRDGRQEVDHCILVPNPTTRWIVELAFQVAFDRGWGGTRVAKFLNDHSEIPSQHKPFHSARVGYWLASPIYYGELVWEQNNTGIIDDTRVVKPNDPEDMLHVPDFCEPLVSRAVWDAIQELRRQRAVRIFEARARKADVSDKLILPAVPGLTLKYLLTGLVRCGHCGRSMNPGSTVPYTTKDGQVKKYVRYVCPGYLDGSCPNQKSVPEAWLREVIVSKIRERLFPGM